MVTGGDGVLSRAHGRGLILSEYRIHDDIVRICITRTLQGKMRYHLSEPDLPDGGLLLEETRSWLGKAIRDPGKKQQIRQNLPSAIRDELKRRDPSIKPEIMDRIGYYLIRDASGLGEIQPFLEDPEVNLVRIDDKGQVAILHRQFGCLETDVSVSETKKGHIWKKILNRGIDSPIQLKTSIHLQIRSGWYVRAIRTPDPGERITCIEIGKHPDLSDHPGKELSTLFPSDASLEALYPVHRTMNAALVRLSGDLSYDLLPEGFSFADWSFFDAIRSAVPFSMLNHPQHIAMLIPRILPTGTGEIADRLADNIRADSDLVRLIRVMMTDPNLAGIRIYGPGLPIEVSHGVRTEWIKTRIIPDQLAIDTLVAFFRKAGRKKTSKGVEHEIISFAGGEEVIFDTRDNDGPAITISLTRTSTEDNQVPVSQTAGTGTIPIPGYERTPGSDPGTDRRITDLLDGIFGEADPDEPEPDNRDRDAGRDDGEPPFRRRRPFMQYLSGMTPLLGKKEEKEPDLTVPQVESVLKIEAYEGSVAEEAYWLIEPHAYAVILTDRNRDRVYRVVEPELSTRERIVLEETHETLRDVLVYDKPVKKGSLFLEYGEVAQVIRSYDPGIPDDRISVLYYYLKRNLAGYGKIEPLMHDELLEDISCNGHDLPVFVHHRMYGSIPTSVYFESDELNRFVLKLSQKADKQVSLTSPLLDAALPTGARAQITYSDVISTKGSSFTIRKFRTDPMTPVTLMSFGTYDPELLSIIWLALENRKSLIVVGGTASGKTSAMNSFSFFIPHTSKIVSLEDTREIQIPHRNWLPVQTRENASINERGNIDLFDLLKASLRQRPEYIIVGEVRGSEAQTLFQAMNSGHTTLSTLHAGTIEEALNRLTNEPINVPPAMFGALDLVVIQSFHYQDGRMIRRCDAIHEIYLEEGDRVGWNTLYEYTPENDQFVKRFGRSKVLDAIRYMHNWNEKELAYQLALRREFLTRLKHGEKVDPGTLIRMITDLRKRA